MADYLDQAKDYMATSYGGDGDPVSAKTALVVVLIDIAEQFRIFNSYVSEINAHLGEISGSLANMEDPG